MKSDADIWEEQYAAFARKQRFWPSEELIAFIFGRYESGSSPGLLGRVLDIGCGTGNNAWFLVDAGFDVEAFDREKKAVELASRHLIRRIGWEKSRCHLRVKSLEDIAYFGGAGLGYEPGSFDGVVDIRTIQHMPWLAHQAIYTEVLAMLKPGGWFFSVHLDNSTYDHKRHNGVDVDHATVRGNTNPQTIFPNVGTVTFPRRDQLQRSLEWVGFEVTYHETISKSYGHWSKWASHSVVVAEKPEEDKTA